ncbi:hypothetical protein FKW77_000679 [Venturia effusa]|uniref:Deacetylase sirtuin-type domain-containing protein n=1 Tax=Venturia effusa TaxID=50376 RepID=A0A517KVP3_9PEZI|nr:hypothetical protein FKW77_000679 [Venturia effusa]
MDFQRVEQDNHHLVPAGISIEDLSTFTTHLKASRRILAICGAGLSASSGMATFRGAGGIWRTHSAKDLSTPEAFKRDPVLVWQFHAELRRASLAAVPNNGHTALAKLGRERGEDFLTIMLNIDGLSERAGHPLDALSVLHGSIFDIRCVNCDFEETTFQEPLVPALSATWAADRPTTLRDLPHCPDCHALLRPGVIWFGECLSDDIMDRIEHWISSEAVDLLLVVGTTAALSSITGYSNDARDTGARMAVINPDLEAVEAVGGLDNGDWWFGGDAAEVLPCLLWPALRAGDG